MRGTGNRAFHAHDIYIHALHVSIYIYTQLLAIAHALFYLTYLSLPLGECVELLLWMVKEMDEPWLGWEQSCQVHQQLVGQVW